MKSKVLMIGAAVCAALFLFSGVMLFRQYADEKNSAEAFDHIAALVQDETPPTDEPQETKSPLPEQTAFDKYKAVYAQNSDFVGWISIEGTNIDYPVMQTIDFLQNTTVKRRDGSDETENVCIFPSFILFCHLTST